MWCNVQKIGPVLGRTPIWTLRTKTYLPPLFTKRSRHPDARSAADCAACWPGYSCSTGATQPVPCAAGSVARAGSGACDPCAEGSRVWGDVSGDCGFTSFDVYAASQYYLQRNSNPPPFNNGQQPSSLCAWRQQQLDLSLDGQFKLVDVQYLLLVVAGRGAPCRFVQVHGKAMASQHFNPGSELDGGRSRVPGLITEVVCEQEEQEIPLIPR